MENFKMPNPRKTRSADKILQALYDTREVLIKAGKDVSAVAKHISNYRAGQLNKKRYERRKQFDEIF